MKTSSRSYGIYFYVLLIGVLLCFSGMRAKAAQADVTQALASVFDYTYYGANYPDAVANFGNTPGGLLKHYMYYGIYEGRNASASFNANDYKNRYPDLVAAYGDNMPAYAFHYVHAGRAEGRDASPVNPGLVTGASQYTLVGAYTTNYNATESRAINIKQAANNLNGTVVAPGQTFSATRAFKPRTAANGYVMAPIIVGTEHVPGMGGGVCQVSSTVHGAVKTAGLKIVERHAHSLPVYYIPEGWDATISGTAKDFKFVNTLDSNIIINADAQDGTLTVTLWRE
ncbi:MAG: VanW family protein [Pseudobutyrivibrio sp.]|nr:VanW family protein [Pseudobutyrivibrio sp.]